MTIYFEYRWKYDDKRSLRLVVLQLFVLMRPIGRRWFYFFSKYLCGSSKIKWKSISRQAKSISRPFVVISFWYSRVYNPSEENISKMKKKNSLALMNYPIFSGFGQNVLGITANLELLHHGKNAPIPDESNIPWAPETFVSPICDSVPRNCKPSLKPKMIF